MNPGSREALDAGCLCPVIDNGRGIECGWVDDKGQPCFWMNMDCPIHGEEARSTIKAEEEKLSGCLKINGDRSST